MRWQDGGLREDLELWRATFEMCNAGVDLERCIIDDTGSAIAC